MDVANALPNRRVAIEFSQVPDQVVIELSDLHHDTALFCPANILTGCLGQLFPPFLETGEMNRSDAFPFHRITIFGNHRRQLLREGEDVSAPWFWPAFLQFLDAQFWSFKLPFQPLFTADGSHPEAFSSDEDG
ncbi:MAG TPA: hypothetical protein VE398_04390 [Acidobacteriota bacterium]|nr:hypothetical protein [Acidobacteriota bacterium]